MKNILVAIDFSNATDAVIHQIGKLACPNDSIIHLLHIVEPSICYEVSGVLPDEVPVPVMDQTEENEVISIAKNHLKKTAEKLSQLTDSHHRTGGGRRIRNQRGSHQLCRKTPHRHDCGGQAQPRASFPPSSWAA